MHCEFREQTVLHNVLRLTVAGVLVTAPVGYLSASAGSATPADYPGCPAEGCVLEIHKHASTGTVAGDGSELSLPHTLAGAHFRIYQVPSFDLTTPEGWQQALNVQVRDLASAQTDSNCVKAPEGNTCQDFVTTNNGLAIAKLPAGLYLVVETEAPADYLLASQPFLVPLPFADPTGAWLQTVHVYPKNEPIPTTTVTTPGPTVTTSGPTTTVTGLTQTITGPTTTITGPSTTITGPARTTGGGYYSSSGGGYYGSGGSGGSGYYGGSGGGTYLGTVPGGTQYAQTTAGNTINGVVVPDRSTLFHTGAGLGAVLAAAITSLFGFYLTKRNNRRAARGASGGFDGLNRPERSSNSTTPTISREGSR